MTTKYFISNPTDFSLPERSAREPVSVRRLGLIWRLCSRRFERHVLDHAQWPVRSVFAANGGTAAIAHHKSLFWILRMQEERLRVLLQHHLRPATSELLEFK